MEPKEIRKLFEKGRKIYKAVLDFILLPLKMMTNSSFCISDSGRPIRCKSYFDNINPML